MVLVIRNAAIFSEDSEAGQTGCWASEDGRARESVRVKNPVEHVIAWVCLLSLLLSLGLLSVSMFTTYLFMC